MHFTQRTFLALALIASLGAFGHAAPAHACSCIINGTPTEAFNQSSAVFSGTVTAVEADGMLNLVTFAVDNTWKGDLATPLIMSTANSSAGCGYEFNPGSDYLVYAYGDDETSLGVSLCSRTALLVDAQDDVNELNTITEATTPSHTNSAVTLSEKNTTRLWILLVGVLGYAAGFLVGANMKKKKK